MEEASPNLDAFLDTVFLVAALILIVGTGLRISRKRSGPKPAEGQRAATIGILVWLGLLGLALYMILG